MKIIRYAFVIFAILISNEIIAQHLKPGFDKQEFIEMLKIGAKADTSYHIDLPEPHSYIMIYQSPQMGLDNRWQLWINRDSVAVISVRGTTITSASFLANLYAAMVSAKDELQLEKYFTFKYDLPDDPKAAVHVGYLISTAYLSRDILPKINSLYKCGFKEFIIAGHSQ